MYSFAIGKSAEKLDTGLMSEFQKTLDRMGLKRGRLGRGADKVVGGDYIVRQKPRAIEFRNGSKIFFDGSKNLQDLKGRSDAGEGNFWGYIFFDEFADYDEQNVADDMIDQIYFTFVRSTPPTGLHPIWGDGSMLDLDRIEYDENGEIIMYVDEYGTTKPRITTGKHTLGCKFLFAYNPPKNKESWIYEWEEEYFSRPYTYWRHYNYTDLYNELIAIGQYTAIAEAEILKETNPIKYRHQFLGESVGVDGLYFHTFKEDNCRILMPSKGFEKVVVGVDFGTQNPTTFIAMGFKDRGFEILDLYRHSNKEHDVGKAPSDYAKDLLEFVTDLRLSHGLKYQVEVYYDPSAKGFKDEVDKLIKRRRSCPLKMRKANNNRMQSLTFLFEVITKGAIKYAYPMRYIDEWEKEIRKAETHKNGDDIVKEDDHFIDATRYALMGLRRTIKKDIIRYFTGGEL